MYFLFSAAVSANIYVITRHTSISILTRATCTVLALLSSHTSSKTKQSSDLKHHKHSEPVTCDFKSKSVLLQPPQKTTICPDHVVPVHEQGPQLGHSLSEWIKRRNYSFKTSSFPAWGGLDPAFCSLLTWMAQCLSFNPVTRLPSVRKGTFSLLTKLKENDLNIPYGYTLFIPGCFDFWNLMMQWTGRWFAWSSKSDGLCPYGKLLLSAPVNSVVRRWCLNVGRQ